MVRLCYQLKAFICVWMNWYYVPQGSEDLPDVLKHTYMLENFGKVHYGVGKGVFRRWWYLNFIRRS